MLQLSFVCMKYNHVTDIQTHTPPWTDVIIWCPYKHFYFDSCTTYFSVKHKYLASPALWDSFLRKQGTFNRKYSFNHEFLTARGTWLFTEIFMEVTKVNCEEANFKALGLDQIKDKFKKNWTHQSTSIPLKILKITQTSVLGTFLQLEKLSWHLCIN